MQISCTDCGYGETSKTDFNLAVWSTWHHINFIHCRSALFLTENTTVTASKNVIKSHFPLLYKNDNNNGDNSNNDCRGLWEGCILLQSLLHCCCCCCAAFFGCAIERPPSMITTITTMTTTTMTTAFSDARLKGH